MSASLADSDEGSRAGFPCLFRSRRSLCSWTRTRDADWDERRRDSDEGRPSPPLMAETRDAPPRSVTVQGPAGRRGDQATGDRDAPGAARRERRALQAARTTRIGPGTVSGLSAGGPWPRETPGSRPGRGPGARACSAPRRAP